MAAVMGMGESALAGVCEETGAQIANMNSAEQIVISGPVSSVTRAMQVAKERGARRAVPLQVSAAFHSRLMEPIIEDMREAISKVDFQDAQIPVIANTTAQPITKAQEIREELVNQISNCVQWQRSVEYMVNAGVSHFVEIGPGSVLTGLIRRINSEVKTTCIDLAS